jgi:8-amino-7-oxononanoate synthase
MSPAEERPPEPERERDRDQEHEPEREHDRDQEREPERERSGDPEPARGDSAAQRGRALGSGPRADPAHAAGSELDRELAAALADLAARGLRRSLGADPAAAGADFTSNDTLGLSRHPDVIAAARAAVVEHGAGSGAARLLGGDPPPHAAAERAAAAWLGAEAALLFPSGYQANLGVVGALTGRGDAVISDARNHASLIDAARLSRARVEVAAHRDPADVDRRLARQAGARRRLVLVESVFSMTGALAPLAELAEVCAHRDAWLVVDEAHAVGLLGPRGAGAWAALDLPAKHAARLAARVVTGGKALGVAGAFVAGSRELVDTLLQRARAFLFTTAPPPALSAALERAIAICAEADDLRAAVRANAATLATALGVPAPPAAILPVRIGDARRATELAEALARRGLHARAVRPPTVPAEDAGLRIVLHATNTRAEVDDLARGLREHLPPVTEPAAKLPLAPALFVAGTDTGIGKTVVSALLVRAVKRARPGRDAVRYWKPVQTGDESDTATAARLAGAAPHEVLRPAWSLPLPASPHEAAADAGVAIDPARIADGLTALRRLVPEALHVVELAGGLLVPYVAGARPYVQADWLERAGAPVVLVARSGLGTLNHTLLSLEALRRRAIEPRALFLVGPPHESNRETLRALGQVAAIFEVPFFEVLAAAALDAWLDANPLDAVVTP